MPNISIIIFLYDQNVCRNIIYVCMCMCVYVCVCVCVCVCTHTRVHVGYSVKSRHPLWGPISLWGKICGAHKEITSIACFCL